MIQRIKKELKIYWVMTNICDKNCEHENTIKRYKIFDIYEQKLVKWKPIVKTVGYTCDLWQKKYIYI